MVKVLISKDQCWRNKLVASQGNPGFTLEAILHLATVRVKVMVEEQRCASGGVHSLLIGNHQINRGYSVEKIVLHQGIGGFGVLDLAYFHAIYLCNRHSTFAGEVM